MLSITITHELSRSRDRAYTIPLGEVDGAAKGCDSVAAAIRAYNAIRSVIRGASATVEYDTDRDGHVRITVKAA